MTNLDAFYVELQAWIDAGFPEHQVFKTDRALCRTLQDWAGSAPLLDRYRLAREITASFAVADLSVVLPFNCSVDSFKEEKANCTIFANPARLNWIKTHAASASSTQQVDCS